jgi:hypothetical protein
MTIECLVCGSKGMFYSPKNGELHLITAIREDGEVDYENEVTDTLEDEELADLPVGPFFKCLTCLECVSPPAYRKALEEPPVLFRCSKCAELGMGYVKRMDVEYSIATMEDTGRIDDDALVTISDTKGSGAASYLYCNTCGARMPIAEKDVLAYLEDLRGKKIYEI